MKIEVKNKTLHNSPNIMSNRIVKNGILSVYSSDGLSYQQFNIKGMESPVCCNYCGKTYDLRKVSVLHRYSDCTQFTSPCCNRMVDDREWKGSPDFQRITV